MFLTLFGISIVKTTFKKNKIIMIIISTDLKIAKAWEQQELDILLVQAVNDNFSYFYKK